MISRRFAWFGLGLLGFVAAGSLAAACGGDSGTTEPTPQPDAKVETAPEAEPDTTADTAVPDTAVEDTVDAAEVSDAPDTADTADGFDGAIPWPTCDAQPSGTTPATINGLWTTTPATPTYSWIQGAYVTGISLGGCTNSATATCQITLSDATSYADLTAAGKHAIRMVVWPPASSHFVGLAVGDKVDVAAWGYRLTTSGQNELVIDVSDTRRGCAKKVGTGAVTPVAATLAQLGTVAAYEDTYGPVLVKLTGVSATTDQTSGLTGGLFYPGAFDAGGPSPVEVSSYYLPGNVYTGYTAATRYDWQSVTGVFGLYRPTATSDAGTPTKYLVVYPRTMGDLVKL
jgi:hypothetical protein